jgi:hypothetical protein
MFLNNIRSFLNLLGASYVKFNRTPPDFIKSCQSVIVNLPILI